jgi:hypothetical protein
MRMASFRSVEPPVTPSPETMARPSTLLGSAKPQAASTTKLASGRRRSTAHSRRRSTGPRRSTNVSRTLARFWLAALSRSTSKRTFLSSRRCASSTVLVVRSRASMASRWLCSADGASKVPEDDARWAGRSMLSRSRSTASSTRSSSSLDCSAPSGSPRATRCSTKEATRVSRRAKTRRTATKAAAPAASDAATTIDSISGSRKPRAASSAAMPRPASPPHTTAERPTRTATREPRESRSCVGVAPRRKPDVGVRSRRDPASLPEGSRSAASRGADRGSLEGAWSL